MSEIFKPDRAGYLLAEERGVLSVSGPEAVPFLQGLVTNDVARVGSGRAVHAALLTPQGRYLHDFFIAAGPEQSLLLDCEAARRQDLLRRLKIYKLRARVSLADATADWAVVLAFGEGSLARLDLPEAPGAARLWGGGIVFTDPRHPALGARAVLPRGELENQMRGTGLAPASWAEYDRLRIALGVPDGSRDLEIERALPMENGFDRFNGIDWQKGCYIGQELTARMKYRALVKKGLVAVAIDGPAPEPGTPVLIDGAEAGMLRSSRDGLGLALLRLDVAEGSSERVLVAGEARLRPLPRS